VSISFAYGGGPETDDVRAHGSPINRLVPVDEIFDPYIGQPGMSNLPVSLRTVGDELGSAPQATWWVSVG
jgi:hypothetical protein